MNDKLLQSLFNDLRNETIKARKTGDYSIADNLFNIFHTKFNEIQNK